jgi:hypothetical protein
MKRRRLVFYIFLNALVSALVTGAILFFYDRSNHKTDCGTSATIPTLTSGDVKADIAGVTGSGTLDSEFLTIQNNSAEALPLTGWSLNDGQGDVYIFPQLTLFPGGTVKVHTTSGTDTAADLYWGRSSPVWKSGQLVALYDTQNIARAFYRVP